MLMFNCLFNNVNAETNRKKYTLYNAILFLFLMCPSDNYSMIQSLQTGISKHIEPRSDYPYRAVPWILKTRHRFPLPEHFQIFLSACKSVG